MRTLTEDLFNNNVLFSYYGFIDDSVLGQILEITKSKLISNHEAPDAINRVCEAITECGENIIKNNFYPQDSKVTYKSLFVISKKEDKYAIDTINVVNANQKEIINTQLNFLSSCSDDQLVALKNNISGSKVNTQTVSTGLLDLVLKADDWDCTFKNMNDEFLFNINYRISCLN